MANSTGTVSKKKTCFVITPIGPEGSEIRRHIDIVIDDAIIPALGEDYEPIIPHRLLESTAITKQIYQSLNESDLVIANLTKLNPNVMYELAIRFCIGKPVIIIAEKDTDLPFDVKDQRAVFYVNDYRGTLELKSNIKKAVTSIVYSDNPSSPIHDALGEVSLFQQLKSDSEESSNISGEAITLILKKLDSLISRSKADSCLMEERILIRLNKMLEILFNKKSINVFEEMELLSEICNIEDLILDSKIITNDLRNAYLILLRNCEKRVDDLKEKA